MEFLQCKACGSFSMVPMDVSLVDNATGLDDTGEPDELSASDFGLEADHAPEEEQETEVSRFYTCHVCGDNWLSIRREDEVGECQLLFIHQMGVQPILKRVARMQTSIVLNEQTVEQWEYYADEEEIGEGEWLDRLRDRRSVLKAICTN